MRQCWAAGRRSAVRLVWAAVTLGAHARQDGGRRRREHLQAVSLPGWWLPAGDWEPEPAGPKPPWQRSRDLPESRFDILQG